MKYQNSWHLLSSSDTIEKLSSDMYKGLTEQEVVKRRNSSGINDVWQVSHTSFVKKILESVFDLSALLAALIVVISALLLPDKMTAVVMGIIVIICVVTKTIISFLSQKMIERSFECKIPQATVIREGKIRILPASELVVGDVVFLEKGDTVPADGRVISGYDSIVSERGITSNKTDVHKFDTIIKSDDKASEIPCEFRSNIVYAGSAVKSGAVRMIVTSIGSDTLISSNKGKILISEQNAEIPLMEKTKRSARNMSMIILACSMVLLVLSLVLHTNVNSRIFLIISSLLCAVASMSDFTLISGYLSISSKMVLNDKKTAENHISFRKLSEFEKLSKIETLIVFGTSYFKSGNVEILAHRSSSGFYNIHNDNTDKKENVEELIRLCVYAIARGIYDLSDNGKNTRTPTMMSELISRIVDAHNRQNPNEKLVFQGAVIDHRDAGIAYSGGIYTSIVYHDHQTYAVSCGDIDKIMGCCSFYMSGNDFSAIDQDFSEKIISECRELVSLGAKVIAVSKKDTQYSKLDRPALITQNMVFMGYLAVVQEKENSSTYHGEDYLSGVSKMADTKIVLSNDPLFDLIYSKRVGILNDSSKIIKIREYKDIDWNDIKKDGALVDYSEFDSGNLSGVFANFVKLTKEKSSYEEDLNEIIPTITIIGSDMEESGAMNRADTSIVINNKGYKHQPERILNSASVLVKTNNKNNRNGFGGMAGVLKAIEVSRHIVTCSRASRNYLYSSHVMKFILLMYSVLSGAIVISPLFFAVWSLIIDLVAVVSISLSSSSHSKNKEFIEYGDIKAKVYAVVSGIISGILVLLMDPLYTVLDNKEILDQGEITSVMCAAVLLLLFIIAIRYVSSDFRSVIRYTNLAQITFLIISVSGALLVLLSDLGYWMTGGVKPDIKMLILLTVPVIGWILLTLFRIALDRISIVKKKRNEL